MEALIGIPFLPDWPASHCDIHFETCFRNRGPAIVPTRQYCFNSPRFRIMEAGSILDLGTGGSALFSVQLNFVVHFRTFNHSLVPHTPLHSMRFVLHVSV